MSIVRSVAVFILGILAEAGLVKMLGDGSCYIPFTGLVGLDCFWSRWLILVVLTIAVITITYTWQQLGKQKTALRIESHEEQSARIAVRDNQVIEPHPRLASDTDLTITEFNDVTPSIKGGIRIYNGTTNRITDLRVMLRDLYFIQKNGDKNEVVISDTGRELSEAEYFSNSVILPNREGLIYIAKTQEERIFFLFRDSYIRTASGWDTLPNNTAMDENFEIALQVDAMVGDFPIHRDFRANIKFDIYRRGSGKVISRVYVWEIKNESKTTDPKAHSAPEK